MKRMSSRDLTLYLLVILLMVFAVTSLQQMNRTEAPTYSQIRSYFLPEQVQSFTLKDNTLRLTLRGEGDQTTTVTYEMSDQALTYFYMDMRELIDDQLAAGILESYDYPPGLANSWWYNWLPSLIVLLCGLSAVCPLPSADGQHGGRRRRTWRLPLWPCPDQDFVGPGEEGHL